MSTPSVMVGIPTHDSERFLPATLASVLAQDHAKLSIVIRDDASSDRTLEICRDLGAGDPRVQIVSGERRLGWVGNYNALLHHARGDYFCFVPHDDLYQANYVSAMVTLLEAQRDAALACSAALRIDEAGCELGEWPNTGHMVGAASRLSRALRYLWWTEREKGWIFHALLRTSALKRTGGLRDIRFAPDNLFVFQLALLGPFAYDPRPLCRKRMVEGSVSTTYGHLLSEWLEYLASHHSIVSAAGLSRSEAAALHAAISLRELRAIAARPFGIARRASTAWRKGGMRPPPSASQAPTQRVRPRRREGGAPRRAGWR